MHLTVNYQVYSLSDHIVSFVCTNDAIMCEMQLYAVNVFTYAHCTVQI